MSPLLLMIVAMLPLGASSPDSPEAILVHIERCLALNNVSASEEYVETVLRDYPGYVPAAIAEAGLQQVRDGNSEKMLRLLESLNSTFNKHWQYYSPPFERMVEVTIKRCRSNLANETKKNAGAVAQTGPEQLLSFKSRFETLLVLSPMAVISADSTSEPVFFKRSITTVGNERLGEDQREKLIETLSHAGAPTPEQMERVECLSKLPADEGIPALIKLLESFDPLSALTAAETLCDYGKAALPAILASLREESPDRRKVLEIYVLVRIGVCNSEIKEVLSSLTPSNPRALAYAPKALNFLSAKAGQSAASVK